VRDLIGRADELARLRAALAAAQSGRGSLLLVSGEAGVGKTRLVEAGLADAGDTVFVRGVAVTGSAPFGPVVAALRSFLRSDPDGLDRCGPLRSHLALLLPELGTPRPTEDRATLFEAIRCALRTMVAGRSGAMLLDDVQASDEATLELLATLAPGLRELPSSFPAQTTHRQSVLEPPPGAEVLARSQRDPHQLLRYAPNALSSQFHPEFTPEFMRAYIGVRADTLRDEGVDPDALLADVRETEAARMLLERFARAVLGAPVEAAVVKSQTMEGRSDVPVSESSIRVPVS